MVYQGAHDNPQRTTCGDIPHLDNVQDLILVG